MRAVVAAGAAAVPVTAFISAPRYQRALLSGDGIVSVTLHEWKLRSIAQGTTAAFCFICFFLFSL